MPSSQTPVSKDLAYQILLSALRVHGYAAIEERGVVKIVHSPRREPRRATPILPLERTELLVSRLSI